MKGKMVPLEGFEFLLLSVTKVLRLYNIINRLIESAVRLPMLKQPNLHYILHYIRPIKHNE